MAAAPLPEPTETGLAEHAARDPEERPEGFEHQQYRYELPGAHIPFVGPLTQFAGRILDAGQRASLEEGVAMRPAEPIPHINAASYQHRELKQMIDISSPEQAHDLGEMWNNLGNQLMDFGAGLQRATDSSETIWQGQAANAARGALSKLAEWSRQAGQGAQYMATTVRTQAEAVATAKRNMPEPVDYNPAAYQEQLNATNNPIKWFQIMADAREQHERHTAAHAEAIRVTETYSAALHSTNGTMPTFTPPTPVTNPDLGPASGRSMPEGGVGMGTPPMSGGGAGAGPGGGSGLAVPGGGTGAPIPTQEQAVRTPPAAVGGPGATGQGPGGWSAAGGSAAPGSVPGVAAGLGAAGVTAAGAGVRGAADRAAGMGGVGPRGPGGVGNPGSANPLGRPGFGPTGGADSTATARGATGAAPGASNALSTAGARAPGISPAFAPMTGAGRGVGGEDTERHRPSYLVETEDVWGDGRRVAPPVIGADPPEYYR